MSAELLREQGRLIDCWSKSGDPGVIMLGRNPPRRIEQAFRTVGISFCDLRRLGAVLTIILFGMKSPAAPFQIISSRYSGEEPSASAAGDSTLPIMSQDGRYLLFASTAKNLILSSNDNRPVIRGASHLNVFLRDRVNRSTTLVSVNLAGNGGGNGDSLPVAISTNGQYALFESNARDLFTGDTNNASDIFLRDLVNETTLLVSSSTNAIPANGVSQSATMTPDGRYVAFVSSANNLVENDTNGIPDVFVRDILSGITVLASAGARATNSSAICASLDPDLTPDGRYVAFFSTATNVVPGANIGGQVFVRDLLSGNTIWASSNSVALSQNTVAFNHRISEDGRFVAYETVQGSATTGIIRRFNLQTRQIDTISSNVVITMPGFYENTRTLDMTPDGRFVAFVGRTNFLSVWSGSLVYVWDAQTGQTILVSGDPNGQVSPSSTCDWPLFDRTGRFIAFLSTSSGLTTNALTGTYNLYLRDILTSTTTLLDVDTNGVGSQAIPTTMPQLTPDAHFVAFEAGDGNLVPADANGRYDVFVRDIPFGTNELISARHPLLPNFTPNGSSSFSDQSASRDGRYVVFTSSASNLVPDDTNGFADIFLRDTVAETNILVSSGTNGLSDSGSSEAVISEDGRWVAFSSFADNLAAGDTFRSQDVFLRDMKLGSTFIVSIATNGTGPGNQASYSPRLSADGRYVLFRSTATDLANGAFTTGENLFLRDMQAGTTYALTMQGIAIAAMTRSGAFVAFTDLPGVSMGTVYVLNTSTSLVETNFVAPGVTHIAISPDGGRLACWCDSGVKQLQVIDRNSGSNSILASGTFPVMHAGLRFSADGRFLTYAVATNIQPQVFLYDFETQGNTLVSHSADPTTEANDRSDWPEISQDGRFVAYRSAASDIVSGDGNIAPDLFLYDRLSGSNTLISVSDWGPFSGEDRSLAPVFSSDGRALFFQTWAADLMLQDFNEGADIFGVWLFYVTLSNNGPGTGWWLSWPFDPAANYRVEFKNALADLSWQPLSGTVTNVATSVYFPVAISNVGARFYRVVKY